MSDEQPTGWSRPAAGQQPPTDPPTRQSPPPPAPGWAPTQPPPAPGWAQPQPQPGWAQPQPGWGPPASGVAPHPPAAPRPGIIPLRPLGVGEILDGAISAIRTHPKVMLVLSLVVALATQVIIVPVTWLLVSDIPDTAFNLDPDAGADPSGDLTFAASTLGAGAVSGVVSLVAVLLLTGILTVAVSRAVLGQSISAGDAWRQARPRIPALIGVTLLIGLVVLLLGVVLLAPGVVLAVSDAPGGLVGLLLVVGGLAWVCLAVYAYTSLALAPTVIVLEKSKVVASMRRSRGLVQGSWWRTFGILLLVNIIAAFVSNILSIPFSVASMGAAFFDGGGDSFNPLGLVPLLISAVGSVLAYAITWPFTAVATTLLYIDRRMRREALDLELTRAAAR